MAFSSLITGGAYITRLLNHENPRIIPLCIIPLHEPIVAFINLDNEGWPRVEFMAEMYYVTSVEHDALSDEGLMGYYARARRWLTSSDFIKFNAFKNVMQNCDDCIMQYVHLISLADRKRAIVCVKNALRANLGIYSMSACFDELAEIEATYRQKDVYARKIQRAYRESVSNPEFVMCRERLMREFTELKDELH